MNSTLANIPPIRTKSLIIITLLATLAFAASNSFAAIINLEAALDGAQANEGNGTGSAAIGSATMTLDDQTNLFSWDISWSGLEGNITVAHFHGPAPAGANAGVQVDIGAISGLASPSIGSTTLDAAQTTDLLAGLWYINIHSDRDTVTLGGEIRGQVLQSTQQSPVPEPTAIALMAFGVLCVCGFSRNRKRKN